jgi:hypothetical protein
VLTETFADNLRSLSSLAVTLGYLRGLEIPSLKLEDMPRL